jgi:hypothetical protein
MKYFFPFFLLLLNPYNLFAQNNQCNELGAWIWYIEATTCKSHSELADSLKKLNIKRVFVKVADGKNFSNWPELDDKNVVKAYKDKGIQVWGWSYNYPNNEAAQAEAIYRAAKTGYQGYIVDVEMEFDNDSLRLYKLFEAFDKRKQDAVKDGIVPINFELRATTWGNPKAHKFNIKAMDKFVSAYMPQTYVEQWKLIASLEKQIDLGNQEYAALGATKPIHHIVAAEKETGATGAITAADVNKYIAKAGGGTSIWRIPGDAISAKNWALWRAINWKKDFCSPTNTEDFSLLENVVVAPNPFREEFQLSFENENQQEASLFIYNIQGEVIHNEKVIHNLTAINTSNWVKGMYFCILKIGVKTRSVKVIKE